MFAVHYTVFLSKTQKLPEPEILSYKICTPIVRAVGGRKFFLFLDELWSLNVKLHTDVVRKLLASFRRSLVARNGIARLERCHATVCSRPRHSMFDSVHNVRYVSLLSRKSSPFWL